MRQTWCFALVLPLFVYGQANDPNCRLRCGWSWIDGTYAYECSYICSTFPDPDESPDIEDPDPPGGGGDPGPTRLPCEGSITYTSLKMLEPGGTGSLTNPNNGRWNNNFQAYFVKDEGIGPNGAPWPSVLKLHYNRMPNGIEHITTVNSIVGFQNVSTDSSSGFNTFETKFALTLDCSDAWGPRERTFTSVKRSVPLKPNIKQFENRITSTVSGYQHAIPPVLIDEAALCAQATRTTRTSLTKGWSSVVGLSLPEIVGMSLTSEASNHQERTEETEFTYTISPGKHRQFWLMHTTRHWVFYEYFYDWKGVKENPISRGSAKVTTASLEEQTGAPITCSPF